ncbi:Beta-1,3-GlcNAc transferase, family GT31 [Zostera marina]|uniref:Hexosyltransferase n=1 Tax=Zostera marina TaxID=29655 RepID=A0A0K9Q3P7_ZOSMR|nr:Beta-1,3-GlcNAc transferase, family GT31 [Zostera marina]
MALVGIHTEFLSVGRRNALRKTWMSSDQDGLRRLEESTGLTIKFVIGRSSNRSKMAELEKEIRKYDDFLLLDYVEENNKNLSFKTLAYFKEAYRLYDSKFYVKVNDGVYLRPDRLSLLLAKNRSHSLTYIGCMKNGNVVKDPTHKGYDNFHYLLKSEYFRYAHGAMYALSSDVVSSLVSMKNDSFRMFSNEDVLIGSWMLAMNIDHEHVEELCQLKCTSSSIAVRNISCSGICQPENQLIKLHKMDICSKTPTIVSSID